jgi:hypothetical protein
MELIVVAVLIQTLYYLAYDQHIFIVLFIGLSLLGQQYTDHKKYYLGIPIVLTHTIYLLYSRLYKQNTEKFTINQSRVKRNKVGRKKRKPFINMKKEKGSLNNAIEGNEKAVNTAQTGIMNEYKKAVKSAKEDKENDDGAL